MGLDCVVKVRGVAAGKGDDRRDPLESFHAEP